MYVDTKVYYNTLIKYQIPFTPCLAIFDFRKEEIFYIGEFNLKNKKKIFYLLESVKNGTLDKEEYSLENIRFNNYFTF